MRAGSSSKKQVLAPIVIGWREYVDLPEWGIKQIQAKADTGARSSAIDVAHIEILSENRVRFEVAADRADRSRWTMIETDIVRRSRVRSSFGKTHDRLVVATTIEFGPVRKTIELGLVNRERMLCRMLLGRVALKPDILVDSRRVYRFGRRRPSGTRKKDAPE